MQIIGVDTYATTNGADVKRRDAQGRISAGVFLLARCAADMPSGDGG